MKTLELKRLQKIEDNGGRYIFKVWKNGDYVDGNDDIMSYDDAFELLKENNADEIEALIWYSEDDYNDGWFADDFMTVYRR